MTGEALFDYFRSHGLNHWAQQLEAASPDWLVHHGDYARWSAALEALPEIHNSHGCFDAAAVSVAGDCVNPAGCVRPCED